MKKFEILILAAILITAFLIRLYKINRPIADWHSWRQADTAAVARNFIKEGYNPFSPKYDDMSSQANGLDNPNRYRFVEFPIYNSIIAGVWAITGINETYARLVTVFITLFSTLLLYFLVKYFSGIQTAILSVFFFSFLKNYKLWLFVFLSLLPFITWRIWMTQFPQGIPNWQFLLNESNIRFKGAFFRWLIAERMGKLILTVGGFVLFILGILKKPTKNEKLFYFSWLLAVAVYFTVFASGNIRHDYYQVPFIPIAAVFMAIGTKALFNLPAQSFNHLIGSSLAIVLITLTLAFGSYEIRGYYWINKPQIVKAGEAVNRLLPKDATVIAPYNGDAAFLYQTNRHGYPIVDRPLEKFIDQGTKYLVSVDVTDAGIQNLVRHCKVIDQTSEYVIVEMFKECIGK